MAWMIERTKEQGPRHYHKLLKSCFVECKWFIESTSDFNGTKYYNGNFSIWGDEMMTDRLSEAELYDSRKEAIEVCKKIPDYAYAQSLVKSITIDLLAKELLNNG